MTTMQRSVPEPTTNRRSSEVVIDARDLVVGYRKLREKIDLTALKDVDLTITRGEFIAIVGPSGCGKTTFINVVAGLVKPWKGTMESTARR